MVWFDRLKDFTALSVDTENAEKQDNVKESVSYEEGITDDGDLFRLIETLTVSVQADRKDLAQGRCDAVLQRTSETQFLIHELEGTLRRRGGQIRLWPEARRHSVETAFKTLITEAQKTCHHIEALHTASRAISNHLLEAAERQLSDGTYRRNGEKQTSKQLSLSQFSAKL